MKTIVLTEGKACKCANRNYKGSDGKDYWYNLGSGILFSTDPHKTYNPKKAIGVFELKNKRIIQL